MSFEVGRLSAALTLDGVQEFNRGLDQAGQKLKATGNEAKTASGQTSSFFQGVKQAATETPQQLTLMGSAFTKVGLAAGAAATVAIAKWANFDQAMSNVSAATHESAANMKLLEQAALDAGARTVFSATEAANAIEELAKAGVSTADILAGGLDGALDLAAAGGLGVADAAGIAATALKTFNLEGSDMSHVADLLAAGAGKAMGDVSDLSAAMNQSAMVANATGLSIEETTAGLAAFASQGLLGSDAGTSFKSMLQSLTPSSQAAADTMAELGISAYDSQGNFIGLAEFAGQLQGALSDLSVEQQQAALKTIFGSDAIRAATVLYSEGADGIREWEDAVSDQGYAADTAAARLDNLKGDLEALGGALDTAFIQSGSGANDALRDLVQLVTRAVDAYNELPAPLQSATVGAALLVAGVGLLGGAFMTATVKAYEFKTAAAELGLSGARARAGLGSLVTFLGGPWGIALGLATVTTLGFNRAMEESKVSAQEMEIALKQGKNGFEAMQAEAGKGLNVAWVYDMASSVSNLGAVLDENAGYANSFTKFFLQNFDDRSAIENVNELGRSLASMASTDLSEAASQFEAFGEAAGLNREQLGLALDEMPEFKSALLDAANAQGIATDEASLLALALGEVDVSASDSSSSATSAADAYMQQGDAAAEAAEALQGLIDALMRANGIGQDSEQANAAYQQTLADVQEHIANAQAGVDGFSASLDANTLEGAKNRDMFAGLAEDSQAVAQAQFDVESATLSAEDAAANYRARLEEGRNALIDQITALTGNRDAAVQFADQVYQIPDIHETEIMAETAKAQADVAAFTSALNDVPNEKWTSLFVNRGNSAEELQAHLDALNNIPGYRETVIATVMKQTGAPRGQVGAAYNFAGGIYGLHGQNFASGGLVSGIYRAVVGGIPKRGIDGTPHIFAEAEMGVPWEAYISGRSGSRSRNIDIALESLNRLGFPVVPASALRGVPRFADGGVTGGASSAPSASHSYAPSAGTAVSMQTNIYGAPGQSEDEIARIAEARIAYRLRGL
ncbi:phage tail tape measure protein [Leucobacter allii]|uniref:Phage tail tape measure protein n=1 Tax=Leucobacter allii TaxID=2932247 RepID=A0ABY4FPH1_9MICO|nr:phage tail tape measure protein [Leucobacter allii]UOQ58094.1 phage tail tape measure protein [Leucobacter allii]